MSFRTSARRSASNRTAAVVEKSPSHRTASPEDNSTLLQVGKTEAGEEDPLAAEDKSIAVDSQPSKSPSCPQEDTFASMDRPSDLKATATRVAGVTSTKRRVKKCKRPNCPFCLAPDCGTCYNCRNPSFKSKCVKREVFFCLNQFVGSQSFSRGFDVCKTKYCRLLHYR